MSPNGEQKKTASQDVKEAEGIGDTDGTLGRIADFTKKQLRKIFPKLLSKTEPEVNPHNSKQEGLYTLPEGKNEIVPDEDAIIPLGIRKYPLGRDVNIPRKDGTLSKAKITGFNENSHVFFVEWREGEVLLCKKLTLKDLDAVNKSDNAEKISGRQEIIAIGDSNGSIRTYLWNLEHSGVIDKAGNWVGGSRRVVIHGDILADRGTDGFSILEKNREIRAQARSQGGDISVLAGNHDDFMFSFLTKRNGSHGNGLSISMINNQGKGLLELTEFSGDKNLILDFDEAIKHDRLNSPEILEKMRNNRRGVILLKEMCDMKLCEQIGDTIYSHTDPTDEILKMILEKGVDHINDVFRTALRNTFFGGAPFDGAKYNKVFDTFLSTGNRLFDKNRIPIETGQTDYLLPQNLIEKLKEQGIKRMVFGHSDLGKGNRKFNIGGIEFVNVDQQSLRNGNLTISAARIKNGEVETGTDMFYLQK